jgi:hypothetical protein
MRVWAEEQGVEVSGRGRLPADVIQQYESARDHGLLPVFERAALLLCPASKP